jgi:hypothetical protein
MSKPEKTYPKGFPVALHLALFFIILAGTEVLTAQNVTTEVPLPAQEEQSLQIKHIDVVMLSHLDVGFTDSPYLVVNELQRRYLDVALDAAQATANNPSESRFRWTAESLIPVLAWWKYATPERRRQFLQAVQNGQMAAGAMPFNTLPFENADEWKRVTNWAPPNLWNDLHPTLAIQDDVNGASRAGVTALADRGVHRLLMGMNGANGGPPFPAPMAFWWKLPDGRRTFVYIADGYWQAYGLFAPGEWRVGDSPAASDLAFRPPRSGEILPADETSVRAAHVRCLKALVQLQNRGYIGDRLLAIFQNQWRGDDEVPFVPISDFVATWNRLHLQPELRLVTAPEGMETLEKEIGSRIPEYEGVWPDWWSNGVPSAPRELAASRFAKRYLHAAASPVFGPMEDSAKATANDILGDLALYEEHTFGGAYSEALPDSLDTSDQFDEKALLALRSNARAAWLFSQRARTKLYPEPEGLYVINATDAPISGWVTVPAMTLRGNFQSVRDKVSGERFPLQMVGPTGADGRTVHPEAIPGHDLLPYIDDFPRQMTRFWVDRVDANSVRAFEPDQAKSTNPPAAPASFTAQLDEHGWPSSLQWPGMTQPLFQGAMGDFLSVQVKSPKGYQEFYLLSTTMDANQRAEMQRRLLKEMPATAGPVQVEETPYTVVYTQTLTHPSLNWLIRRLEVWKQEPRARLDVRFDRKSSVDPEIFYLQFQLPVAKGILPELSEGGVPFVPYKEQIPGTCSDYFAIDSWAHYSTPQGHWLWVTRDAPVLSLGAPNVWSRISAAPEQTNRLLSMVFNNTWFTNYVANSNGVMNFQYDLVWRDRMGSDVSGLAESLSSDPVALINPAARENQFVQKDLFKP